MFANSCEGNAHRRARGDVVSDSSFLFLIFFFFFPAAGRRLAGTASRRLRFEFSNPYNSPYTPFAPFTPPARRDVAHNKRRAICSRIPPFLPFSAALSTRRIALPTRGKRIGPSKHSSIPLRLFRPSVKYFSHIPSAMRYSLYPVALSDVCLVVLTFYYLNFIYYGNGIRRISEMWRKRETRLGDSS